MTGQVYEVPDDEEVVGEPELVDHPQFPLDAVHHLAAEFAVGPALGPVPVSLLQPFKDEFAEEVFELWPADRE